jgi:hypothetical protein
MGAMKICLRCCPVRGEGGSLILGFGEKGTGRQEKGVREEWGTVGGC